MERITWVIEGILARAARPGRYAEHGPLDEHVATWITEARRLGIRTIICLLDHTELESYYGNHGIDLLDRYRTAGFKVNHFPIPDHQTPAVDEEALVSIVQSVHVSERPVLIHCSAGVGRTGAVVQTTIEDG